MKIILPVVLFTFLIASPNVLLAQQDAPATAVPPAPAPTQPEGAPGWLQLNDMDVIAADGEKVGEVEDVLIDTSGQAIAVVVEVGGVLGIGDDDVIIQLDQLRLENNQLVTTLTKEQMEALPKWDD